MKTVFQLLLLLLTIQADAQKKALAYDGSIRAGLLEGANGSAFQLQTVNGIRYKTWSVGLGAGMDYYMARSIPVFLELRKSFGASTKAPFVYADGGANFPWLKEGEKEWGFVEANRGLYMDAGLGYQIPVLKKSLLFFTLGYSQKNYSFLQSPPVWMAVYPSPPMPTYRMDFTYRRLSIKTGLRF